MADIQADPNCIFCKIAMGEVPSKKVMETEHTLAILDINPAAKGHSVILPKTHAQIFPQLGSDFVKDLAITSKRATDLAFKAMKSPGVVLFLANGQLAGQKVPHVLLHMVPTPENGGLPFDLEQKQASTEQLQAAYNKLVPFANKAFGSQLPLADGSPAPQAAAPTPSSAPTPSASPVPMDASGGIPGITPPPMPGQQPAQPTPQQPVPTAPVQPTASPAPVPNAAVPPAQPSAPTSITEEDLRQVLETNPKLKDMLINDPEQLKQRIATVPQLQTFFAGVDVDFWHNKLKGATQQAPDVQASPAPQQPEQLPIPDVPDVPEIPDIPSVPEQQSPAPAAPPQPAQSPEQPPAQSVETPAPQEQPPVPAEATDAPTSIEDRLQAAQDSVAPAPTPQPTQSPQQPVQQPQPQPSLEQLPLKDRPKNVSVEELLQVVNTNPKLKDMLTNQPETLREKIATIPQLQNLFQGFDIDELHKMFKAQGGGGN